MARKDYVNRGCRGEAARRDASQKKRNAPSVSNTVMVIAATLVVFFIGIIWLIFYKKQWNPPSLTETSNSALMQGLPPKPEERWRYIKELENRHPGARIPSEPQLPAQLRQIPYSDPRQAPADPASQTAGSALDKNKSQSWLIQCGSFRAIKQAEAVRAQLAFAGIESYITASQGWNRVVLGPYSDRHFVGTILQQLTSARISDCIPVERSSLNPHSMESAKKKTGEKPQSAR